MPLAVYQWIFVELFLHLYRCLHLHCENKNIEKLCQMCHLKGFFIMKIDLTGCPFYVLYHWTFNGNIFAIKYWKWMSCQTNYLKNRISRKHYRSTFFTMNALLYEVKSLLIVWRLNLKFQTKRGKELVEKICLIVFQCN